MKEHKRRFAGTAFLAAGLCLLAAARFINGFSQWYVNKIYPVLVESIGRVTGLLSFSVVEISLYIILLIFVWKTIHTFQKKCFCDFVADIFLALTILFFLYCSNCGVNYYRTSFAESAGLDVAGYTTEDLKETCEWLTKELDYWAEQVIRIDNGEMHLSVNERDESVYVMKVLGEVYPELEGFYPQPKGLLNHWILSVQSLSGIYSPFTIEANYNTGMTDYNIPFTACHELSHLRGFMQEEEANFIAFLACIESETADFRYSGYLLGWIHCMNLLYRIDYEAWEEIRTLLPETEESDLRANSEFWDKYDGKVAEVANKINDTYLKANGQDDGVESYGRMADLIVIYYCKSIF